METNSIKLLLEVASDALHKLDAIKEKDEDTKLVCDKLNDVLILALREHDTMKGSLTTILRNLELNKSLGNLKIEWIDNLIATAKKGLGIL